MCHICHADANEVNILPYNVVVVFNRVKGKVGVIIQLVTPFNFYQKKLWDSPITALPWNGLANISLSTHGLRRGKTYCKIRTLWRQNILLPQTPSCCVRRALSRNLHYS